MSPVDDTTYELVVSCPSDPTCEYRDTVRVEVHAPPTFGAVEARDLAECNEGIELTWEAVSEAAYYHLYFSLNAGVTRENSARMKLPSVAFSSNRLKR